MIKQSFQRLYDFFESHTGHWFIGSIVLINALLLGVQTFEKIPENIENILHHIDQFILYCFIFELCIKLFHGRLSFFKNGWNIFDFLIIVGSLFHHHDYLPILRAFRSLHLMSAVDAAPKMRHVLSGLWKAMPGILNVLGILVLFFYISCVMGVFLFRDTGMAEFQHIGMSMKTMFQVITGDDWSRIMHEVEATHPYAWMYFIFFYTAIVFIILNLFIGVTVGALQSAEAEVFSPEGDAELLEIKKQLLHLDKKMDVLVDHLLLSTPQDKK